MRYFRLYFFLSAFVFAASLWSATITLINESEFDLTAVIRGKDGTLMGEVFVDPIQTKIWDPDSTMPPLFPNDNRNMQEIAKSFSPFTISWLCMGGRIFSVCPNVVLGNEVSSKGCTGRHWCEPKVNPQE